MKKFNLDDVKENSKIVDINEVCFNPWNPKVKRSKEYEKVKESVRVNGLSMPIVVREINDDNYKYQVLDGEQRLTAALDLGFDKIWVVDLGEISDEEAKSKTIWMEMAVPFDQEQLGKLLVELVDKVELPYTDNEIKVISGVELETDDVSDDDFEDEYNNTLKSFSVHVLPENKDFLKDEFKKLNDDLSISDNTIIITAIKNLKDTIEHHGTEMIQKYINEEKEKEINFE